MEYCSAFRERKTGKCMHLHAKSQTQYMEGKEQLTSICAVWVYPECPVWIQEWAKQYGTINKDSGCIKTVGDGHVHTAVYKIGNQ